MRSVDRLPQATIRTFDRGLVITRVDKKIDFPPDTSISLQRRPVFIALPFNSLGPSIRVSDAENKPGNGVEIAVSQDPIGDLDTGLRSPKGFPIPFRQSFTFGDVPDEEMQRTIGRPPNSQTLSVEYLGHPDRAAVFAGLHTPGVIGEEIRIDWLNGPSAGFRVGPPFEAHFGGFEKFHSSARVEKLDNLKFYPGKGVFMANMVLHNEQRWQGSLRLAVLTDQDQLCRIYPSNFFMLGTKNDEVTSKMALYADVLVQTAILAQRLGKRDCSVEGLQERFPLAMVHSFHHPEEWETLLGDNWQAVLQGSGVIEANNYKILKLLAKERIRKIIESV